MKIFKWVSIVSGSFFTIIFIILIIFGLKTQSHFKGSLTKEYKQNPAEIWAILSDLEHLPQRRPEVVSVIITDYSNGHPWKWKEEMDLGGFIKFEAIEWRENKKLELKMNMDEGIFLMEGVYTYILEPSGTNTKVTVIEDSTLNNFFTKAMYGIAGRDSMLKEEHRILNEALE